MHHKSTGLEKKFVTLSSILLCGCSLNLSVPEILNRKLLHDGNFSRCWGFRKVGKADKIPTLIEGTLYE